MMAHSLIVAGAVTLLEQALKNGHYDDDMTVVFDVMAKKPEM